MGRSLCVVLFVSAIGCGLSFGDEAQATDSANEWVKAAENRVLAAAVQKEQAVALLARADALRTVDHGDQAKRAPSYVRIGDLERSAGELAGMASINGEKAASNWLRAAAGFDGSRRGEQARNGNAMADDTRNAAWRCVEMAAEAYERAAEAYSSGKGNSPAQEAAANEGAATWREKLASSR